MRIIFYCLLFFNFCHGCDECIYPPESITYADMTIECTKGCGTYDDPKMQEAWRIFQRTVKATFKSSYIVIEENGCTEFFSSPVKGDYPGDYISWDWNATDGVLPSEKNRIIYRNFSIYNYPTFLQSARALRDDTRFYYLSLPKIIRKFEINLSTRLEEGLAQGYNIYRILPSGEIEFWHQKLPPHYLLSSDWEWITSTLDHISRIAKMEEKSESRLEEAYKQAENRIERAIAEMDELFQLIFIYCLKHHQPEGIAFSSAIESLLAGNLAEGIEYIRKLIEIGKLQDFPSEMMGKMHLLKGQLELESNLYAEAILSLTNAITKNPLLKESYLERGAAYFQLEKYDCSMEDYLSFAATLQPTDSFHMKSFSLAFAKKLIPGCCESGRGLYLLLSEFVQQPLHTSRLIWESLTVLSKLAVTNEWEQLAEAIAPEIHQLVVEWDSLSFEKRGELTGYAFGKYGADLLIPAALLKVATKGLKYGTELSAAYKNLRAADQTLLLESLSSLKSGAKIEEAVLAAQETTFLGEELGLTTRHMGEFFYKDLH